MIQRTDGALELQTGIKDWNFETLPSEYISRSQLRIEFCFNAFWIFLFNADCLFACNQTWFPWFDLSICWFRIPFTKRSCRYKENHQAKMYRNLRPAFLLSPLQRLCCELLNFVTNKILPSLFFIVHEQLLYNLTWKWQGAMTHSLWAIS